MGTAENKAVMRRIFDEVVNGKDLDLAEELYSEEHELHPDLGVGRGGAGMKQAFAGLHEQFREARVVVDSMVAEADMVAVRLTWSGTDVSTGEHAIWLEMVFTRFADGRAVESWEVTDSGRSWPAPPW